MGLHILIPCKSLERGKSRLSSVLSPRERRELCGRLLERTLRLGLALAPARHVKIITVDREACAIAEKFGIGAIDDGGAELNEALRRGRDAVLRDAGAQVSALILPIDLVYATPAAIERATAVADVAIAPDQRHRGTNLLFLAGQALAAFTFAFGSDSYCRHRRAAEEEGFRVESVEDPLLAFDIDRPEDWRRWQREMAAAKP
jgi:2-phospho-L-lactate guanylyltransferase